MHVHVVPRFDQDTYGPIFTMFTDRPTIGETEAKRLADRLQLALKADT